MGQTSQTLIGIDPSREEVVKEAILEISHIATLPEVTLKIISLVEDPDSTAQDLNDVISNDPALGTRILKVVNSAFYGLPGQIGSINRAIVLLGLNAVKNIAIAASLAKLFRGGQICPSFNARDLWTHCIAVGTATRMLADKAGLGLPDEAFLGGLIHDIGIMVAMQGKRAQFVEMIEKLDSDDSITLRQAELEVIGATHEDFGAALCQTWKFPSSFSYVTGYHHRPKELGEQHRVLAAIVHLADVMCCNLSIGYSRGSETTEYDEELLTQLNLKREAIDEIAEELSDAVEEATRLLGGPTS